MARQIKFEDAARLVGGGDSTVLAVLDGVLSAGLVALAPATAGASIGWFDVKSDVMRLLGELRLRISPRLQGTTGYRRAELLTAAHTILVVSAFFDALDFADVLGAVRFSGEDQQRIAARVRSDPEAYDRVGGMLRAEIPAPGPQQPYDVLVANLRMHYAHMVENLLTFVSGLAFWDECTQTQRDAIVVRLRDRLPDEALLRYEQNLGQFAQDCPEFVFWTNLWEHIATREILQQALSAATQAEVNRFAGVLREMRTGLDGLAELLQQLHAESAGAGAARWRDLAMAYAADVTEPEASGQGAPSDVAMPALADIYVNPAVRVAEAEPGIRPGDESWWRSQTAIADLQGFLVGYLTSAAAVERPMLILGNPGAGKSALTRVLAARLGQAGYQPLRVDLSRVPADASIVEQIEHALRMILQRATSWADMADSAGDLPPVVILDGFDELLQASPMSRADYLEQVRAFQRSAAGLGRPAVVIVTSRTVVAPRVRIPAGSTILALEPFDEVRIGAWLRRWNEYHRAYFAQRGLDALTPDNVMRHRQLAEQPLLLLLLALYDMSGNALQRQAADGALNEADLYERLLRRFVDREVRKNHAYLDDADITEEIEDELYRLAIAAYAMFNRGTPYVVREDLDHDLRMLDPGDRAAIDDPVSRRSDSAAERLASRFYFMHVTRAMFDPAADGLDTGEHGGREWRTYEFLHATFGEYLVARLAANLLGDLRMPMLRGRRLSRPEPDDTLPRALLSWQPLTIRSQAVAFLLHLAGTRGAAERDELRSALVSVLRGSLRAGKSTEFDAYQPAAATVAGRSAVYSLNVVVLLLAVSDGTLSLAEAMGDDGDPLAQWQRLARLWRAALDAEAWHSVVDEVGLIGAAGQETLKLIRQGRAGVPAARDANRSAIVELYRENLLLRDPAAGLVLSGVGPLAVLGDDMFRPAPVAAGSAAGALVALACLPAGERADDAFRDCLAAAAAIDTGRGPYLHNVIRLLRSSGYYITDDEVVVGLLGSALDAAVRAADLPLTAEVVQSAAERRGRSAELDERLRPLLASAVAALAAPTLAELAPAARLALALTLADLRLPPDLVGRTRHTMPRVLDELDVAAIAGTDARLLLRVLRTARRECLDDWLATTGAAVVKAAPEPVRRLVEGGY